MMRLQPVILGASLALSAATAVMAQSPGSTPLAPGIKAEALWDGRKIVPFKAIDNPKMVPASAADFMADGEYVLGVTVNGESRAYPTRFAWWHHVINDQIGNVPYAVTYCSVCNTALRFDLRSGGKTLKLDFYGLYNGVVTLCDRETGSVVLQVEGRVVTGPLLNTRLKKDPVLDTTWAQWKKLHPDTKVMSPDNEFAKFYRAKDMPEPRGYDRFPRPFFQATLTRGDLRLPPFEKVLGVAVEPPAKAAGEAAATVRRAYPIQKVKAAGNVVNDEVAGVPMAVLLEPDTVTAVAVSRMLEGKTLTFEARSQPEGKVVFYDRETGTRWSVEGVGLEGALAGKSLARIENHLSQWYGWAAYFPETTLFGHSGPPQPGDPFETKSGDK